MREASPWNERLPRALNFGHEITGMFAAGLTHGYGGIYTYDRWDGHALEIDPETKTLKGKMGAVNLLAM